MPVLSQKTGTDALQKKNRPFIAYFIKPCHLHVVLPLLPFCAFFASLMALHSSFCLRVSAFSLSFSSNALKFSLLVNTFPLDFSYFSLLFGFFSVIKNLLKEVAFLTGAVSLHPRTSLSVNHFL